MMVRRCVLDKDKLLISKPGNDVLDPNLTDDEKVFDSRWPFTNMIIANGYYGGGENIPVSGFTQVIPFLSAGGIPLVDLEVVDLRTFSAPIGSNTGSVVFGNPLNFETSLEERSSEMMDIVVGVDNITINWSRFVTQSGQTISSTSAFRYLIYSLPMGEQ